MPICCAFLTEKLYSVEGVREAETFIYLDIVKEIYAWDPPPNGGQRRMSVTHETAHHASRSYESS